MTMIALTMKALMRRMIAATMMKLMMMMMMMIIIYFRVWLRWKLVRFSGMSANFKYTAEEIASMEMAVGTVSVAAGVVGVMVKVMVMMVTVAEVIYMLLRRQLFC